MKSRGSSACGRRTRSPRRSTGSSPPSGPAALPAVHRLLDEPRVRAFVAALGSVTVKVALDGALDDARAALRAGDPVAPGAVLDDALARLDAEAARGLVDVLNGTGVLLHTNLGRAPLGADALAAIAAAAGATNLEYDLGAGARGARYDRLGALLRAATGAEDGIVVNNAAAAVLLIVDTFARGRAALVARGEAIEIGGGLRIPELLARAGASLVEIGTTNKLRLADVARALGPDTGLVLRMHPSNFRLSGFTEEVPMPELVALGRRVGVPIVEDLGSGAIVDLRRWGLPYERTVGDAVADGLDLVAFSGDKLLGGPQAGIVVGRRAAVARLRANPLLRALRVDKATIAALGATLRCFVEPADPERVPLYAMIAASVETLRGRAAAIARALEPAAAQVVETRAEIGAGALPERTFPSAGLALAVRSPDRLAATLRRGRPPLVARIDDGRVVVDLRAIPPASDATVAAVLRAALAAE